MNDLAREQMYQLLDTVDLDDPASVHGLLRALFSDIGDWLVLLHEIKMAQGLSCLDAVIHVLETALKGENDVPTS